MSERQAHQTELRDALEARGIDYDPNGPLVAECPYCGTATQYARDHQCYGTRGEDHDARMMDDRD